MLATGNSESMGDRFSGAEVYFAVKWVRIQTLHNVDHGVAIEVTGAILGDVHDCRTGYNGPVEGVSLHTLPKVYVGVFMHG